MVSPPEERSTLLEDALKIWKAGVAAVDSSRLVMQHVSSWKGGLNIAGCRWSPRADSRICVVGAGKAGAGMAAGLEQALGPIWLQRTSGWVNVPEDCIGSLEKIHLHGARPAGVNEPTAAGVAGTQEILQRVQDLRPQDLCIVLISGGGSALMPAPIAGITLEHKLQITRTLMRLGATISELNTVRRSLSAVKGGGLLRSCGAGQIVALIISDVIGDPLETIASGPTIPTPPDPQLALNVLEKFSQPGGAEFPPEVIGALQQLVRENKSAHAANPNVVSAVIGNNRTAVEAAATQAGWLGYQVVEKEWDQPGEAAESGRQFAERLLVSGQETAECRLCIISGGETTVQLARTSGEQRGGRNQEFALAALNKWLSEPDANLALVSGGTDGEDGPTDAAGAFVDNELLSRVRASGIDPATYLTVNNSYPFFERFNGLLKTGPTHTNVMDLRVGLIGR